MQDFRHLLSKMMSITNWIHDMIQIMDYHTDVLLYSSSVNDEVLKLECDNESVIVFL